MKEFDLKTTTYSLLYSVYSFPNLIVPVFTGIIINKLGKRKTVILFTALVFLG